MKKPLIVIGAGVLTFFLAEQFAKQWARMEPAEIRAMVDQVNAEMGNPLDPLDVMALISIESGYHPDAVSSAGAIGLMQVLYTTAQDRGWQYGPAGLFDPLSNIRIGMAHMVWSRDYLRVKLGRQPTVDEWIGSYNAGVGNVVSRGWWPLSYVAKWRNARAAWA